MAGRPRTLADAAKRKAVQGILSVGGTREVAARYVGVHPRTLDNEMRRDPQFKQLVHEAETSVEVHLLRSVRDAAGSATHWRAAVWQLERRFPERYNRGDPTLFTVTEVEELLRALCDVICDEVTESLVRQRIVGRLDDLLSGLSSGSTARKPKKRTRKR